MDYSNTVWKQVTYSVFIERYLSKEFRILVEDFTIFTSTGQFESYQILGSLGYKGWVCQIDNEVDKLNFETTYMPSQLQVNKWAKIDAINENTKEILKEGFRYSGDRYSLDLIFQSYFNALNDIRTTLTYPINVPKMDGQLVSLDSAAKVLALYTKMVEKIVSVNNAGNTLVAACSVATTQEELDAVIDSR